MIALSEAALHSAFRRIGLDVRVALSRHALSPERLSTVEHGYLASIPVKARRVEWLTGRAAIMRLRSRMGANLDGRIRAGSDRGYSLTHSAGIAVAVASQTPGQRVGIDLELGRCPDPRAAHWFLSADEQRQLREAGRGKLRLLRIWTAKEALYKADPQNAGHVLADYVLANPMRAAGRAFAAHCGSVFRYASLKVMGGYLSIALCD